MALGDVIARLSVELGMNTAAFEKNAKQAGKTVDTMKGRMQKAGATIAGAFAGMIGGEALNQFREMGRAALDSVGGLGEVATQLGVTTDALQEFRYVASQTGIEQGEIDKALQRLTRTMGELQDPTLEQAEAMKRLGLTAKDFAGLDASQGLVLLADRVNQLPDAATRSAVGFDLMGRSFQTLLPLLAEGSTGIQQMIADARAAGIVLTEEQIAKADKSADALVAIEQRTAAELNKIYVDNADALVKFDTQVEMFKVSAIGALAETIDFFQRTQLAVDAWDGAREKFRIAGESFAQFKSAVANTASEAIAAVNRMITGIGAAITGRLNAIWDSAKKKVQEVGSTFAWLYDKVVGNSWVPDMVTEIGQHMTRLDTLMVGKAKDATGKTSEAFRELARDTKSLMDRLYPEMVRILGMREDIATIDKAQAGGLLSGAAADDARYRARLAGAGVTGPAEVSDSILNSKPITVEMINIEKALGGLAGKAQASTVKIAKTFKDMADETLGALQRMTDALKGGGFLDILGAVLGLGLQLGSIGAFGKKFQTNINSAAFGGFRALGGPISAGRAYVVGERGPELFVPQHRGHVFSNKDSFGGGGMGGTLDIRPSPLFEVYVDGKLVQAAPGIAGAGAALAGSQAQFARSRRLA